MACSRVRHLEDFLFSPVCLSPAFLFVEQPASWITQNWRPTTAISTTIDLWSFILLYIILFLLLYLIPWLYNSCFATSFSHNTSGQFYKARRFGRVAPAIFKYATEKKMPTFYLLVRFLELSERCGASSRRSCGNVTFGVDGPRCHGEKREDRLRTDHEKTWSSPCFSAVNLTSTF